MLASHVIREQHLHIGFNGAEADAMALHKLLSDWCRQQLTPVLEQTLDHYVSATEYWSVDRLDLDLGQIPLERLKQDLPILVAQSLEKCLQTRRGEQITDATPSIRQQTTQSHLFESFGYFLIQGHLPWGLRLPANISLEQALLETGFQSSPDLLTCIIQPVLVKLVARKRLVRQFSEAFLHELLEALAPDLNRQLKAIFKRLSDSTTSGELSNPSIWQLWETAFALVTENAGCARRQLLAANWQALPSNHPLAESLPELLERNLDTQSLENRLLIHPDTPGTDTAASISQQTDQSHLFECFRYFLMHGRLPAGVYLPTNTTLEQFLLDTEFQTSICQLTPAIQSILVNKTARERLLQQFSETFLRELLEVLAPNLGRHLDSIRERLAHSPIATELCKALISQLWESAFALAAENSYSTERQLLARILQTLPPKLRQPGLLADQLESCWPGITQNPDFTFADGKTAASGNLDYQGSVNQGTQPEAAANESASATLQADGLVQPEFASDAVVTVGRQVGAGRNLQRSVGDGSSSTEGMIDRSPLASEGFYIDNAGLILLHPFLPQLFGALQIVVDDKLIKPERALNVLHFLATGRRVAPEYELLLPKVLCNIALETPVAANADLTDAELEEAQGMLNAVIRHWEVLKNTGIDALRGTFLLRPGKLMQRDDGDWVLMVEPQGFDILLNQLPWGLGMVKLPWMPRLLWVEWPY